MRKGFISIISLVVIIAFTAAILGAGFYYQHNKKISASLVENVNQDENANKEIPAEEIKAELDPAESAPEEVKQEDPKIETVDVKNNIVETAEVKTDDQKKIDEELKKAEEARKQAEIAKKKAEEEQRKLQEQARIQAEQAKNEIKQANQEAQIQLSAINSQLMDNSAKMAKLTEDFDKESKSYTAYVDLNKIKTDMMMKDSYLQNLKAEQKKIIESYTTSYDSLWDEFSDIANPNTRRELVDGRMNLIKQQLEIIQNSIKNREKIFDDMVIKAVEMTKTKFENLKSEYNNNYKQLEIERQNLESQRQYWESQLNN